MGRLCDMYTLGSWYPNMFCLKRKLCYGTLLWHKTLLVLIFICLGVRSRDVLPQHELYLPDYSLYHNYSHIKSHILQITAEFPHFIRADWSFHSRKDSPQIVLHLTDFKNILTKVPKRPKQKVLFSYGEHAREFFPVETMFVFIEFLLRESSSSPGDHVNFSKKILTEFEMYIIVMANPDGRLHLEKSQNYCWRGTSTGVDLNRNFNWQFGNTGSSNNPEDEEYRGQKAFSEPECDVFRHLTKNQSFNAFVSFHSGIRQIYIPFADTKSKQMKTVPNNYENMLDLAKRMSTATSHVYKYGEAYKLNDYTADGAIFDYMAGVRNIPFSFAIELWGEGDHKGNSCFDIFNPKSENLKVAAHEVIPLYTSIFDYLLSWNKKRLRHAFNVSDQISPDTLKVGQVMLLFVVIATCYFAVHRYLPARLQCFPRRRIISIRNLSSTFKSLVAFKNT